MSSSADSVAVRTESRRATADAVLFVALAAAAFTGARTSGSYELTQWPVVGLVLVAALWLLVCAGRRPDPRTALSAGLLVALAGWTIASPLWGGLPDSAWIGSDLWIIGAAALAVGTLLGPSRAVLVGSALATAATLQGLEILARVAVGDAPTGWFYQRTLEGPVGYHNAEGALFAVAIPFALYHLASPARLRRMAGGAAATVLVSALLLTQSRGALAAAAIAVGVQVVVRQDVRASIGALWILAAGGALLFPLQRVDAALAGGVAGASTPLRNYAAATAAAGVAVACAATFDVARLGLERWGNRRTAVIVLLLTASLAFAFRHPVADRFATVRAQIRSDAAPSPTAGSTRFTSLSLNGRLSAWRIALRAFRQAPLDGIGAGRFTGRWTAERDTSTYILQPHSVELEVAAESGAVGLALFAGFVAALLLAVRPTRARAPAAAAGAACAALLVQASVDWTWSFPGLVAPVLVAAGAAAGTPRRTQVVSRVPFALLSVLLCLVGATFAVRFAAEIERRAAVRLAPSDPAAAAHSARLAERLDRWDPAVLETRAQLARRETAFGRAARDFERAAKLSRHSWLDELLAAKMFARTGGVAQQARACRAAQAGNPLEPLVKAPPCHSG